jgi:hypothetical protein
MRARLIAASALTAIVLAAQQSPEQTLAAIRKRITERLGHLPNYLCTETVDRKITPLKRRHSSDDARPCGELWEDPHLPEAKMPVLTKDRLRLDVAMVSKGEIYSWVGESEFGDKPLEELVTDGAFASGAFGAIVDGIFGDKGATFTFKTESESRGRRVLSYDFRVPVERSHYLLSQGNVKKLTGYSGSFVVDAKTLDLVKLDIECDPPSPDLQLCAVNTSLEYEKVTLNNLDFQLPSTASVRMVTINGMANDVQTVFKSCRQFSGESKLIVGDTESNSPTTDAVRKKVHLAPGIKASVALAEPIDTAIAAAGDAIRGTLTRPIKDSVSGIMVPKGTPLQGRVMKVRLERSARASVTLVGLKWESLEHQGVLYTLDLAPKVALGGTAGLPLHFGSFPDIQFRDPRDSPGIGVFVFPNVGSRYQLPIGFETEWVTIRSSTPPQ